jgi:hypothetical protein
MQTEMETQLILTFMSGPRDGETLSLLVKGDPPEVILGRMNKCIVRIEHDPDVSRVHAKLSLLDGKWWLEDKQSTNGTYLGEFGGTRRVTVPEALSPGQIFRVGSTRFRLEKEIGSSSGISAGFAGISSRDS